MLVLLIILLLVAAVGAFIYFSKRRSIEQDQDLYLEPPMRQAGRSLFEPSVEDTRAQKLDAARIVREKEEQELARLEAEKSDAFYKRLEDWKADPANHSITELLRLAGGNGELFAEAAETLVGAWRAGEIEKVSAKDLLQLLESHFWLIPAGKRTPGVSFRVNTQLSSLRAESDTNNQTQDS